jgi:hypothetical protein
MKPKLKIYFLQAKSKILYFKIISFSGVIIFLIFTLFFLTNCSQKILTKPQMLSNFNIDNAAFEVLIKENYAYVVNNKGLEIIDISDKKNPKYVSFINTPGDALAIFLEDNYAFVADNYEGVQIIDISNKENPKIIQTIPSSEIWDIFIEDDHLYIGGRQGIMQIYDIKDKENPQALIGFSVYEHIQKIIKKGDYLYSLNFGHGLSIFKVSNDYKDITALERIKLPSNSSSFFIKDDYAYVANTKSGLQIINISKPESKIDLEKPRIISNLNVPTGWVNNIFIYNNYAYLTDGESKVYIVDISNKEKPKIINFIDIPNALTNFVYVEDNYCYVTYLMKNKNQTSKENLFNSGLAIIKL